MIAPKLRWVAHHEPDVFHGIATVFGSYDFIAHRLTGSRTVEDTWALEFGLMEFDRREFTSELTEPAGIDASALPPICASHEVVGTSHGRNRRCNRSVPRARRLLQGCADHVASAYAGGSEKDGDLVLKFGGAGDILLSTSKPVTDPRLFHRLSPSSQITTSAMAAWPRRAAC